MKTVIIIGNCNSNKEVAYWCNYFDKRGYKVLDYPRYSDDNILLNHYENFYENIKSTNILFILNNNKNGIEGYIDATTFAEITYVVMRNYYDNKKIDIYISKLPNKTLYYYDELSSFISKGIIKIFKENFKVDLIYELMEYEAFDNQEKKDKDLFIEYMKLYKDPMPSPKVSHLLSQENNLAHFCASAFVINKNKTKLLTVFSNILNTFTYPTTHANGREDLLSACIDEVKKLTAQNAKILDNSIFSIQTIPITGHIVSNEYIPPHIHLDVVFLLELDDTIPLVFDKNVVKNVKWITIEDFLKQDTSGFLNQIHKKLLKKLFEKNKSF